MQILTLKKNASDEALEQLEKANELIIRHNESPTEDLQGEIRKSIVQILMMINGHTADLEYLMYKLGLQPQPSQSIIKLAEGMGMTPEETMQLVFKGEDYFRNPVTRLQMIRDYKADYSTFIGYDLI